VKNSVRTRIPWCYQQTHPLANFLIESLFVEVQMHCEQTMSVKALLHPLFLKFNRWTGLRSQRSLHQNGVTDVIGPGNFDFGPAGVTVKLEI